MRRFHAYNVGLPRTGTTSVAAIFSGYRSAHEFMMDEATADISDHASGRLAREDFAARVLERERDGDLEMNSSSFNHAFLDVLVENFPQARFVFTLRDCWSWADSLLLMFACLRPMPLNLQRYAREGMGIPLGAGPAAEELSPEIRADLLIGPALAFWARANQRVLDMLPADRSLILRTSEISRNLPQMAAHVDVPVETLRAERTHARRSPPHWSPLHSLGAERLAELAREAGCDPLMGAWFPTEDASLFLDRNAFLAQFRGT